MENLRSDEAEAKNRNVTTLSLTHHFGFVWMSIEMSRRDMWSASRKKSVRKRFGVLLLLIISLGFQIFISHRMGILSFKCGNAEVAKKYFHKNDLEKMDRVHTVVMIPTVLSSGRRRKHINDQFFREKWRRTAVTILYILGTRGGERLEKEVQIGQEVFEEIENMKGRMEYVFSACRDVELQASAKIHAGD